MDAQTHQPDVGPSLAHVHAVDLLDLHIAVPIALNQLGECITRVKGALASAETCHGAAS